MRVFLTGGTGFIGQALARVIRDRGWQLDALVRRPDSAPSRYLASLDATLIAGDVTHRESMRAAMARADLVIHNAGIYEFGANAALRQRMQAANVGGTENTLGLALELGKPRSVYVRPAADHRLPQSGRGPQRPFGVRLPHRPARETAADGSCVIRLTDDPPANPQHRSR